MENYTKSSTTNDIQEPLHNLKLDENAVHMQVKVGSKIQNLMTYALKRIQDEKINQITWNGTGDALNKVVACAEIMKNKVKNLYQINKIGFQNTEDIWNAKMDDLRDIKVTKKVPAMCIILSKTPLNTDESGYQKFNIIDELFIEQSASKKKANKPTQAKNNGTNNSNQIDPSKLDQENIYVKRKKISNAKN